MEQLSRACLSGRPYNFSDNKKPGLHLSSIKKNQTTQVQTGNNLRCDILKNFVYDIAMRPIVFFFQPMVQLKNFV